MLELILNAVGWGGIMWWSLIHIPSTAILGLDEIVESHGRLVTTLAYLADLFLWSAILVIPMAYHLRKQKKQEGSQQGASA